MYFLFNNASFLAAASGLSLYGCGPSGVTVAEDCVAENNPIDNTEIITCHCEEELCNSAIAVGAAILTVMIPCAIGILF